MSETEVEVEDYEEVVGNLYYDASVEAGPNADSFKEPTLNQNVSSLTPQNRPILRSSNLSLAVTCSIGLHQQFMKLSVKLRETLQLVHSFKVQ